MLTSVYNNLFLDKQNDQMVFIQLLFLRGCRELLKPVKFEIKYSINNWLRPFT